MKLLRLHRCDAVSWSISALSRTLEIEAKTQQLKQENQRLSEFKLNSLWHSNNTSAAAPPKVDNA
ncbi:hypothetical protein PCC6311_1775 [Synechococcus elongatus PCC 6311]|nr:hypothetical protein PCC7943_1776 [Synechococcus elongatus PCC 7943]UOW74242.1 hypothetical protein PCC6311_1775 [Synechococcus elongatus PCC 6311]UOW76964.1 hypothetical protein PCC6301pg_1777 [Synechococcus elongatus PCC 6301]